MNPVPIEWDQDLEPKTPEEEYRTLLRVLRRGEGFGLVFVKCSPAQGERIIARVQQDLTTQKVGSLRLSAPTDTLYDLVTDFPAVEQLDVLFISGLEYSIYEYEDAEFGDITRRSQGKLYEGTWLGVPRLLGHLNLRRESFREHFNLRLVFLIPEFVRRYFIRRAPDFFDWRSAVLEFPMDADHLHQESQRLSFGNYDDYLDLIPAERRTKILEIKALLEEPHQTPDQAANLYFEQGRLWSTAEEYQAAIDSYDHALHHKPDKHEAWNNRGSALGKLGRYEEAIDSFDHALHHKPDYHWAWNNRGIALWNLGRYEEAIDSFDHALHHKPDLHEAWYGRGNALDELGRYEEAIDSYDHALHHKPDYHEAWNNRGYALDELGRYEEAIDSYDHALHHKPDDHEAWYGRGNALGKLGRYEEAIDSYDRAIKLKPEDPSAFYNKACCYGLQGKVELALENLQHAIHLNPDEYRAMAKTDTDFDSIREDGRFQALVS